MRGEEGIWWKDVGFGGDWEESCGEEGEGWEEVSPDAETSATRPAVAARNPATWKTFMRTRKRTRSSPGPLYRTVELPMMYRLMR